MPIKTKTDWQAEADALLHYLQVERGLTAREAQALIRLLYMGDQQSQSLN